MVPRYLAAEGSTVQSGWGESSTSSASSGKGFRTQGSKNVVGLGDYGYSSTMGKWHPKDSTSVANSGRKYTSRPPRDSSEIPKISLEGV